MTNKKCGPALVFTLALTASAGLTGCGPPGPRALLDGEELIKADRYPQAVERLQKATELLPKTAQAWNHLGLAYHGNQQRDDAVRAYQTALALDPKLASARFNLGCLLLEKTNLAAATQELTTYTLLQPTHVEGWLRLGTVHLRARQLDFAERCFKNALDVHPRHPDALNSLGVVQFQRRRWQDAWNYFNLALSQAPDHGPALLNIAIVNQQALNNRPAALKAYRQYLALPSRSADWQTVDDIARQIDAELRPAPLALKPMPVAPLPAVPRTAHVAIVSARPVTNPPPVPRTNPPAVAVVRPVPPTNPPTVAVRPPPGLPRPATNPVTFSLPALPATPVTDEVVIKPAQDLNSRPVPAPVAIAFEPPRPVTPAPVVTQPDPQSRPDAAKPGLLARLNPFSRKPKQAEPPKPSILQPSTTNSVTVAATPPVAVPVEPPPPPPIPRYPFRSPAAPGPGDRAQAQPAFARAVKAHQSGNRKKAVEEYQTALRSDPSWFDAYHYLALVAQDAGQLGLALIAYETALALKPESADTRYDFALALKYGGYALDAADQLDRLLRSNPNEARYHLSLANLYAQQLRKPGLARQHYDRVLALNPNHPEAPKIRAWLATNP